MDGRTGILESFWAEFMRFAVKVGKSWVLLSEVVLFAMESYVCKYFDGLVVMPQDREEMPV